MSSLFPGQFKAIPTSFQAIALDNATEQALTVPPGAQYALIQAIGKAVNWRNDGVAPVAGTSGGMVLAVGVEPQGIAGSLAAYEFISTDVAGSILLVSYFS